MWHLWSMIPNLGQVRKRRDEHEEFAILGINE